MSFENSVYYKNATSMSDVPDESVQLIITSPPYFNIKDYALDGRQEKEVHKRKRGQIGDIKNYQKYLDAMVPVWQECFRVLAPNGKLVINTPLMPMLKKEMATHYNRDVLDLDGDIRQSIKSHTDFHLLDIYIWNRTNPSKKLMFGSYPHPRNFYAQNTIEFLPVYVKDGKPNPSPSARKKNASKLSQEEWVEYTKQVWNIPIPNKGDLAFGIHSALMPEEIVRRFVKLYTFVDEVVLDPFTGSGTTLKVAKELKRKFVGYEINDSYRDVIERKLLSVDS